MEKKNLIEDLYKTVEKEKKEVKDYTKFVAFMLIFLPILSSIFIYNGKLLFSFNLLNLSLLGMGILGAYFTIKKKRYLFILAISFLDLLILFFYTAILGGAFLSYPITFIIYLIGMVLAAYNLYLLHLSSGLIDGLIS